MGQCGCGSSVPKVFKIAPNLCLVIEQYGGCDDCNESPAIMLHVVNEKENIDWLSCADEIVDWYPEQKGTDAISVIKMIGKNELVAGAKSMEEHFAVTTTGGDAEELKELIDDGGYYQELSHFFCDHGSKIVRAAQDVIDESK